MLSKYKFHEIISRIHCLLPVSGARVKPSRADWPSDQHLNSYWAEDLNDLSASNYAGIDQIT
jgi:hypothetical protein